MSSDKHWVLSRVGYGPGRALDLGGGTGELHDAVVGRGFEYVNVDLHPTGPCAVRADAHDLPFEDDSFDLVLSSDSFEHFQDPQTVASEVQRVLRAGGRFVIWVPFLFPFHDTDYYRYTPLGLRHILQSAGLEVESFDAPLGLVTLIGQALVVAGRRVRAGGIEPYVERAAAWLDARLARFQPGGSFAAFYLVHATKAPQ